MSNIEHSGVANGDAGRLHRIAKTVVEANERQPQDWFQEWAEWLTMLIGTRPKEELGTRAHENWNLVALGSLLAWGYFAEQLSEGIEDVAEGSDSGAVSVPDGDSGVDSEVSPGIAPPTFAVLGPDGEPLIEGYRG